MSDNQHFYYAFRISLRKEERDTLSMIERFSKLYEMILIDMKEIAKHYCFQLECTDNNNYHYGGWVNLHKRVRLQSLKYAHPDIGDWHYSWQIVHSPKGSCNYNMKTDTRIKGPWADKATSDEKKKEDLNEKYAYMLDVSDIVIKDDQLYDWQKKAKKDVLEQNDRQILWIYDTLGGKGKTALVRNLVTLNDFGLITYAKCTDITNIAAENIRPGWAVNLTRTKPSELGRDELYAALESLKDGLFMSGKYGGSMNNRRPCKMIVVANHPPSQGKMSADRFIIRKV